MENFDIGKYIQIAVKRKYWIIIPFLVVLLAGMTHILITPKIYEASTLILVQPQKVPKNFVHPIVQTDAEDRLRTITQQVTSRTNLESIIEEYKLYSNGEALMQQKVALLRKRILITVGKSSKGGNTFIITFRHSIPKLAMNVTNILASNFISENLRIRESQALGTSSFLADEMESVKRRLLEKEEIVKEYQQKYMGGLPEHLQTNISMLSQLQMRMEQLNSNLRDAQNRKLILQQQISDARRMRDQMAGSFESILEMDEGGSESAGSGELEALREKLEKLRLRYTDNHPDVKRIRKMIEKIEKEEAAAKDKAEEDSVDKEDQAVETLTLKPTVPAMDNILGPQLRQINAEIGMLNAKITETQNRMNILQKRIEETPKREQEMIALNRDYVHLKNLYDSLVQRKLEAELAVSMEKKQKGEQFRIIDPAKLPELPVEPDVRKIVALTLFLALALGCGLAYGVDILDTSYRNPDEVEKELGLPILASMPIRYSEMEMRKRKRTSRLLVFSILTAFFLAAAGLVIGIKGVDSTLAYIKNFF